MSRLIDEVTITRNCWASRVVFVMGQIHSAHPEMTYNEAYQLAVDELTQKSDTTGLTLDNDAQYCFNL